MTDEEIKQALQEAVEDIEHELEVSKQFPYLHKPREVAKQLVYRCGYGKVKQYQEEIERLRAENAELKNFYDIVKGYYRDLDNLTKRLQDDLSGKSEFEANEQDVNALCYMLDFIDGDIDKSESKQVNIEQVRKEVAKEILLGLRSDISQCYGDYALEVVDGYIESYGVEVDK